MSKVLSGMMIGVLLLGIITMRCEMLEQEKQLKALQKNVMVSINSVDYLAENLPDYSDSFLKFNGRVVTLADRVDSLRASVESIYIPVEGSYEVTVSLDSTKLNEYNQLVVEYMSQLDSLTPEEADSLQEEMLSLLYGLVGSELDAQTSGFTLTPQIGFGYTVGSGLDIGVGARLYYRDRLGLGLEGGVGLEGYDPWVGAYFDVRDFVLGLRNLGLGIGVRHHIESNRTGLTAGFRAYL